MSACHSGSGERFLCEPVKIDSGLVQGVSDGEVTLYKGVPFAASPVGDLRWRPPQPVPHWSGVLRADVFKPMCMSSGPAVHGGPMEAVSEDCLYLNIWTPKADAESRLPVIVWIYGGGFRAGSASTPHYWGDHLVKKGVVSVNLSYRVGVFGFLAHPDLSNESHHGASGNYGIMDMVAALKWVRTNIARFGGDPDNITIFGQSAGAFGVGYLMVSPIAEGLFHRAIGHSGADMEPAGSGLIPLRMAEESGVRLATALGASSIAELRLVSAEKILAMDAIWPAKADRKVKRGTIAVMDGYILPRVMYDAYELGQHSDVPILVGYNANDGKNLLGLLQEILTAEAYVQSMRAQYGVLAGRVLELYPACSDTIAAHSQGEHLRDNWFAWPMWTWARLQSQHRLAKAYLYRFSHGAHGVAGGQGGEIGAVHGSELPYVFENLELLSHAATEDDRFIADIMSTYWTNFARKGDPNAAGLPWWPEFSDEMPYVMNLERNVEASTISPQHQRALELQDEHATMLRRAARDASRLR